MNQQVEELEVPTYEEYTVNDIYKELVLNNELILVIERIEEPKLRRTLSVLKAKDNAKLKENGFQPDDSKLEFIEIPSPPDLSPQLIKLQIVLKSRVKVKVYAKTIPSGDLD